MANIIPTAFKSELLSGTHNFADETFSSVTLTAAFAAIYNDTNSDKLCLVLDFGGNKTATNGDFVVQFPTADATDAIIRIA
jgi:hypothetical protein